MKLGSLFDGSGGFPLGAVLNGIEPVWASEIEPFPIRVTTRRFPNMKHYGNVAEIDGGKVEPVDIITFGSPCQDMSIAGKRAGLDGSRSNLFYEAVRIIKEMRKSTNGIYPRYAVWENVTGAFSSNKGEDFRCVLEAMCRISDEEVYVPSADKWQQAGCILGGHYSVAWRTFDAQYWGVPQRRKRIYLVADFAGECATEILFKPESVSWHTPKSFQSRQRVAGCATDCTGTASLHLNEKGGQRMEVADDVPTTLRTESCCPPCVLKSAGFCTEHSAQSRSIGYEEETSPTLRAGVVPAVIAVENHPNDSRVKLSEDGNVQALTSRMGTGGGKGALVLETPKTLKIRSGCEGGGKGALIQENKSATLGCNNDQVLFCVDQGGDKSARCCVAYGIDRAAFNQGVNAKYDFSIEEELMPTMVAKGANACAYGFYPQMKAESIAFAEEKSNCIVNGTNPGYQNGVIDNHYIVRRLTPTECARLQGFPDWWCDGLESENPSEEEISWWANVFETHRKVVGESTKPKTRNQIIKWLKDPHSDSAEYKMWGNGVALPCVDYVLRGIVENKKEDKMSIPQITDDEKEILQSAIASYGEQAQEDMLFEEMSELEKSILKLRRTKYIDESKRSDVIEELADVYIMVTQMYMRFCCTKEEKALFGVNLHKKIERLSQYIERDFQ